MTRATRGDEVKVQEGRACSDAVIAKHHELGRQLGISGDADDCDGRRHVARRIHVAGQVAHGASGACGGRQRQRPRTVTRGRRVADDESLTIPGILF